MNEHRLRARRFLPALLAALGFSILAVCVLSGALEGLESAVYASIARHISPGRTALARAVTCLCDPPTVVLYCLVLLLLPRARRGVALPVVGAAATAAGVGKVLKHLFLRARPEILWLVEESGYSFPSGHSITSAAVGTALVFQAARRIRRPRLRALCTVLGVLYPLLVGVSRIYLGVHHAGDVLGGWVLGFGLGWAVQCLWEHWSTRGKTP